MYRIFDFLIESNIALPELPETESGTAAMTFQLASELPRADTDIDWRHHWQLPNGQVTISLARIEADFLLRFPDLADFHVNYEGSEITGFPQAGVPEETIRHLLLDQVVPRVAGHNGCVVLHASAVNVDGAAIAFSGHTGWGKSTLAASFHESGYPLMTDDSLQLSLKGDEVIAVPGYAGARLWQDSVDAVMAADAELAEVAHYSSKRRVVLPEETVADATPLPARAVFVLNNPEQSASSNDIRVEPITGAQAVVELVQHSFHLDITDRKFVSEQFRYIGELATAGLTFYHLEYPRDHARLAEVRDAVLNTLT